MNAKGALLCLVVLSVSILAFGQSGYQGITLEKNIVFPQFVIGAGFTTELFLMNPRPGAAVTGDLRFFGQDGTPLLVLTDPQSATPVNHMSVAIPATGAQFVRVFPVIQDNNLTIGWAVLNVAAPASGQEDLRTRVSGSVVYTSGQGDSVAAKVGSVATNYTTGQHKRIAVPVVVQGDTVNTGVALVNASANPLTLTFELRDAGGNIVQSAATINPPISPLAPGHQVARFVTEIFQGFGFSGKNFQGTLLISTEQEGLEAIGLLQTNLLLTSVPVVHFAPATTGGQVRAVTNSGFTFSPANLTINAGDSVKWTLATMHNVVEVSEATWNANGNDEKPAGFSTDFGGGTVVFNTPGTYFYVCSPHSSLGMKGKIVVQ